MFGVGTRCIFPSSKCYFDYHKLFFIIYTKLNSEVPHWSSLREGLVINIQIKGWIIYYKGMHEWLSKKEAGYKWREFKWFFHKGDGKINNVKTRDRVKLTVLEVLGYVTTSDEEEWQCNKKCEKSTADHLQTKLTEHNAGVWELFRAGSCEPCKAVSVFTLMEKIWALLLSFNIFTSALLFPRHCNGHWLILQFCFIVILFD